MAFDFVGTDGPGIGDSKLKLPQAQNQYGSQPSISFPQGNTPYGNGGFGTLDNPFTAGQAGAPTGAPANFYGNPHGGGYGGFYPNPGGNPTSVPGTWQAGNGYLTGSTYDPALTGDLFGYLQSQIGQQSAMYPGQISADPNDLMKQMMQFFTSGGADQAGGANGLGGLLALMQGGGPGGAGLQEMARTGDPTDVGAAWQQMVAAQQQNIQQNQAQLKEQMSAGGNLVGTPYGNTMANFQEQTAKDQNSLLGQMQAGASEAAAGRKLGAGQILQGDALQAGSSLAGTGLQLSGQEQQVNQQALQSAYQEWVRTQPQNSPLLSYMYGAGTTMPPYLTKQASSSPWSGLASGLGSILGGLI